MRSLALGLAVPLFCTVAVSLPYQADGLSDGLTNFLNHDIDVDNINAPVAPQFLVGNNDPLAASTELNPVIDVNNPWVPSNFPGTGVGEPQPLVNVNNPWVAYTDTGTGVGAPLTDPVTETDNSENLLSTLLDAQDPMEISANPSSGKLPGPNTPGTGKPAQPQPPTRQPQSPQPPQSPQSPQPPQPPQSPKSPHSPHAPQAPGSNSHSPSTSDGPPWSYRSEFQNPLLEKPSPYGELPSGYSCTTHSARSASVRGDVLCKPGYQCARCNSGGTFSYFCSDPHFEDFDHNKCSSANQRSMADPLEFPTRKRQNAPNFPPNPINVATGCQCSDVEQADAAAPRPPP